MSNVDLQIEEIESARKELKKYFGTHYELCALTNTIPLLEELKLLRQENGCDKCEGMQWDALYHSEIEGYNRALDDLSEKLCEYVYDKDFMSDDVIREIAEQFKK